MDDRPILRVLVVGDAQHSDFAHVAAELRAASQTWFMPNRDYAAAWLADRQSVDWIVLLQSRPGQLPHDTLDRLQPLAVQARFVSVLGSWCEGELRTGRPWPDVPRCYWYAFPSWWRAEAVRHADHDPLLNVVVSASDHGTAECLFDAIATEGVGGVWWPRHAAPPVTKGIDAGIWVGGQLSGPEAFQLDFFCRTMRSEGAPVLALLDFPRTDGVRLAKRIGISDVLGMPWLLDDVVETLNRITKNHSWRQAARLSLRRIEVSHGS